MWHNAFGGGGRPIRPLVLKNLFYKKPAFTLAEVLVVLILLGTVSAITIPSAIRREQESVARTRIKKAITVYTKVVETVIIEQGLPRTKDAFNTYMNNAGTCSNARGYFKVAEVDNANSCIFKTSDGIWWDFTTPSKVMVATKRGDLTQANAVDMNSIKAFYLVMDFDGKRTLRVLDINFGYDIGSSMYVLNTAKVNALLEKDDIKNYMKICSAGEKKSCIYYSGNSNCYNNNSCVTYYMDANGKFSSSRSGCSGNPIECTSAGIPWNNYTDNRFAGNDYLIGKSLGYYVTSTSCNDIQGDGCNKEKVSFMLNNTDENILPANLYAGQSIPTSGTRGYKVESFDCPVGENNLNNCTAIAGSYYQYNVRQDGEPHSYYIRPQADGTYNFSHAEDNVGGVSRNAITHETRTGCPDMACSTYKSRTVYLYEDDSHPDVRTGTCTYTNNKANAKNPAGCPPA